MTKEQVEQMIEDLKLGASMRRLRLKKSMGLVQLGERTELSASYLSQLETGRVVPTLRNLARIALVFDKDLSWFFEVDMAAPTTLEDALDRAENALVDVRALSTKKEE